VSAREGLTTTARDGGSVDVAGAIIDHLDLWTGAVTKKSSSGRGGNGKVELTGVKKLRELILELAVRGKLLPQNKGDSPVSQLLDKIKAERESLTAQGIIKNKKPLPDIQNDEQPFELPCGWKWVRLGEIVHPQAGFAFKSRDFNDIGKGLPLIRIRDVGQEFSGTYYSGEYKDEFVLRKGDYLIGMDGIFRVAQCALDKALLNQRVTRLIFYSDALSAGFIGTSLQLRLTELQGVKAYTTVDHLSGKQISEAVIGLPPEEEQHRIVQKVDELIALCDRLEQQTSDQLEAHETLVDTLLGTLTQSENATELADNWARLAAHFDTLFTTEQSIDKLKQTILHLATAGKLMPFEGAPVPLKNVLSFGPRNGFSPKESNHETGFKVLKLGATTKGWLDLLESKNVDIGNSVPPHLWLKKGDILIQRGNAANHVGCNVLLDSDYPNYIYPDLMMKVRVKEEVAIPSFVALYLSAPEARQFMWERMTGTSGTMPKISKKVVEEIPVSLPDIETQKAVVQKVDELMALCDQLTERLNQAGDTRCQLADAVVENALN